MSENKLLSKIASNYKKPDGLTVVLPDRISQFIEDLEIRDIHGIGKKTEERLAEEGVKTISNLKDLDVFSLVQMFGRKSGTYIFKHISKFFDYIHRFFRYTRIKFKVGRQKHRICSFF